MADKKISALTSASTPVAGTEVLPIVQSSTTKQVSIANLTSGRDIAAKSVTVSGEGAYGQGKLFTTGAEGLLLQAKTGSFFDAGMLNAAGDAYAYTVAPGTQNMKLWGETTIGNNGTQNHTVNGNLVMASSGKGIDFSATTEGSGTMTSELLADYEEGTWTPVFESLDASFTYTEQYGSYTKVGRLVIAQFRLKVNAATGTVTNAVNIAGLPFTSASLSALSGGGVAMGLQNFTGFVVAGSSGNNSTTVTLWKQGTTSQPLAVDTAGVFLNGTAMYFAA
jgi:hypothetical protein